METKTRNKSGDKVESYLNLNRCPTVLNWLRVVLYTNGVDRTTNKRSWKMWLIQLLVVLGLSVAGLGSYVKLPARYTAMKGDIPVSFHINKQVIQNLSLGSLDSQVYGSGQSLFAMVHLWYLEGDSYLFSTWSSMNAKPVASLAVPLGVTDGTVVFPCGAVVRAGPHAARLTVNGKEIAQSSILNVEWPAVNLIVPSRLETYSNDVEIEAKLTTNLCSQMLAKRTDDTTDQLPFQVDLELVQCSESVQANADCQVPTSLHSPKVWFTSEIGNLYTQSSFKVQIQCSVWGQPGTYRMFLRTNLTHMAVVSRSQAIIVDASPEYKLGSYFSSIFPCPPNDIKTITVRRPKCSPLSDKIRAYGQSREIILGNIIAPKSRQYLGEVRVNKGEEIAVFKCDIFSKKYWRFCFDYVTSTILGTVNTTTRFCMPAHAKGEWLRDFMYT